MYTRNGGGGGSGIGGGGGEGCGSGGDDGGDGGGEVLCARAIHVKPFG